MMQKNLRLIHFLVVYPCLWIFYCLFELISGNISTINDILMNLLPAFLLFIIACILFAYYKKSLILRNITVSIIITIFFLIDQLSKVFISIIFKNKNLTSLTVIPNYLSITPDLNDQGSFIASRFDINAPFIIFIILNFLILSIIFFIYKYLIHKNSLDTIDQITFIFLFSGGLCSLIDKLLWGGSLDFLHIHNLFIADIKDIFITLGLGSFILANLKSDDKVNFKELISFIFKKSPKSKNNYKEV